MLQLQPEAELVPKLQRLQPQRVLGKNAAATDDADAASFVRLSLGQEDADAGAGFPDGGDVDIGAADE